MHTDVHVLQMNYASNPAAVSTTKVAPAPSQIKQIQAKQSQTIASAQARRCAVMRLHDCDLSQLLLTQTNDPSVDSRTAEQLNSNQLVSNFIRITLVCISR